MTAMFDDEVAELRRANAELRRRLHEALAREVATAEVLQVINSSPVDLQPVFDAMVEKATRLCGAAQGALRLYDGEGFPMVACADPQFLELGKRAGPLVPGPDNAFGAFVAGERVVHLPDVREQDWYHSYAAARAAVDMAGMRSWLGVALHKESTLLGVIVVYRQAVRPFSQREIALLQNFAAQAVIAMENARLLGELRERTHQLEQSLEYQTATSDVLQVISRSTFDLQPVLDTLIHTAARLCQAERGHIATRDGDVYRPLATFAAVSPEHDAFLRTLVFKADNTTVVGRTVVERKVVHVADLQTEPAYASAPGVVRSSGTRTALGVPLLLRGDRSASSVSSASMSNRLPTGRSNWYARAKRCGRRGQTKAESDHERIMLALERIANILQVMNANLATVAKTMIDTRPIGGSANGAVSRSGQIET